MINIEQGRRWKHYQLTTTNNKHFTLETSIMEKIFDASGYNFHVLTINGHRYWIGKEIAHAFGYKKVNNMFRSIDKEDFHTLVLTNSNGHKRT